MGFGKDGKGFILYDRIQVAPGTLAALDAVTGASRYSSVISEDFRIIKADYWIAYEPKATADKVLVGMCDGELTAAEVEEALESVPSDLNDNLNAERTMRPVWPLEMLGDMAASSGELILKGEWKPRWTFHDPEAWDMFVYNPDNAVALTDASIVTMFMKIYGVWVV